MDFVIEDLWLGDIEYWVRVKSFVEDDDGTVTAIYKDDITGEIKSISMLHNCKSVSRSLMLFLCRCTTLNIPFNLNQKDFTEDDFSSLQNFEHKVIQLFTKKADDKGWFLHEQ